VGKFVRKDKKSSAAEVDRRYREQKWHRILKVTRFEPQAYITGQKRPSGFSKKGQQVTGYTGRGSRVHDKPRLTSKKTTENHHGLAEV